MDVRVVRTMRCLRRSRLTGRPLHSLGGRTLTQAHVVPAAVGVLALVVAAGSRRHRRRIGPPGPGLGIAREHRRIRMAVHPHVEPRRIAHLQQHHVLVLEVHAMHVAVSDLGIELPFVGIAGMWRCRSRWNRCSRRGHRLAVEISAKGRQRAEHRGEHDTLDGSPRCAHSLRLPAHRFVLVRTRGSGSRPAPGTASSAGRRPSRP